MSKTALVTGGAIRLGRAITLGLVRAGYQVVVNYHSSADAAHELVGEIEAMSGVAYLAPGDVSNSDDVSRIAEVVRESCGSLDLLVNNASIFGAGDLLTLEETEWDRVMGVNLKGPFLMARAVADMLTASQGSIVNIVDLSAFQPWTEYPHHSVSKAGLLQLTRVLARVLAPHVRANAIAPGAVLLPEHYSEEQAEALKQKAALGKLGSPSDIVRTVLFLADSPFITGEVVVVDGGRLV